MEQAIGAYRSVTATDEFVELERLRSRARHNEASALGHARREAEKAKAITIAQNLLNINLPIDNIVTATGLTRGEVEDLNNAL